MQEFFRTIALCHTVQVAEKKKSSTSVFTDSDNEYVDMPEYQASSPDEKALLEASYKFGFQFISEEAEELELRILNDADDSFTETEVYTKSNLNKCHINLSIRSICFG